MNRNRVTPLLATVLVAVLLLVGCQSPVALISSQMTGAIAAQHPAVSTDSATANPAPVKNVYTPANVLALGDLYDHFAPGVVNIRVKSETIGTTTMPNIPQNLLPPGFNVPQSDTPQIQYGEGSGWVWDNQGHIVTNYHVVRDATYVVVTFNDEQSYEAKVVGTDPDSDLAVLDVERSAADLTVLPQGNSETVRVGDSVVAIGNPFGLTGTMTQGIISAKGRVLPNDPTSGQPGFSITDVLQTDAAINPGNSGGPLFDAAGEVIGVNFQIEGRGGDSAGIGFAIPISLVKEVVPQLIQSGEVNHAWLGIEARGVTVELAKALDLPTQQGAQVMSVVDGSPADKAGLQGSSKQIVVEGQNVDTGGDIIVDADGTAIHSMDQLVTIISHHNSGDTLTLTVYRDHNTTPVTVDVTLSERPQ